MLRTIWPSLPCFVRADVLARIRASYTCLILVYGTNKCSGTASGAAKPRSLLTSGYAVSEPLSVALLTALGCVRGASCDTLKEGS